MDPDAAWDEFCQIADMEHVEGEDLCRAYELADGLVGWVSRGGFLPERMRHMGGRGFLRVVRPVLDQLEGMVFYG